MKNLIVKPYYCEQIYSSQIIRLIGAPNDVLLNICRLNYSFMHKEYKRHVSTSS